MKLGSLVATIGLLAGTAWLLQNRGTAGGTAKQRAGARQHRTVDDQLHNAIEDTFPASDPYSIETSGAQHPDRPMHRQPAAIDQHKVGKLADEVDRKLGGSDRRPEKEGGIS